MTKLDFTRARDLLQGFEFKTLFIEALGWSQPAAPKPLTLEVDGDKLEQTQIAQLGGVVVLELRAEDDRIPSDKTLRAVHAAVSKYFHENLLIFVGQKRTQSLWYYVKREGGKSFPRPHHYFSGQPGDLFLSKLASMIVDIAELDERGEITVVEVARRLRDALDVERVTKKFYAEFQQEHLAFLELVSGIDNDRDRRWYASVLLNRLMFIYFLQRKGFLDGGDVDYLQNKLAASKETEPDAYYRVFLTDLFFQGFAKPEEERTPEVNRRLGKIKYLNGGLFLEHQIEERWKNIRIPDRAFENLYALFERYSWNLNDTPGGDDNELNPDVLGYIFEKYINQKAFGAYYTRTEITEYLCERTIHQLILDRLESPEIPGFLPARKFESMGDLLLNLDAGLCRELIGILPKLSILDPACGSAAFLVAAMKTLINVYSAIFGKIEFLNNQNLKREAERLRNGRATSYSIKKLIITDNLFGVDVMEEATEIAKLRLFLALVSSADTVEHLEPLPNIDFNILAGNSLIGLMHVDDADFDKRHAQGNLFIKSYKQLRIEKNLLIDDYRHATTYADDLRKLRDNIDDQKRDACKVLNDLLFEEFKKLGIKFEEATWDETKNAEGKPKKRPLRPTDIDDLKPFHWGYEFDQVLNERGGFDAIITNPPWEIFKPQAKEFFAEHSDLVTKNKMTIKDFEREQAELLKDDDIRRVWLEYQSRFPHVSLWYRGAAQFKNQISVVNGKKAGTDINLYKLFLEQCFNLLRKGGRCGIITPGSIYNDLGAKQLREMLFSKTKLAFLFGLSNEKFIFEGVHHSQKICLIAFEKGGETNTFQTAFRINPREAVKPEKLDSFLRTQSLHVQISVQLVCHLSPDSLSLMEFKNETDIRIAEKMLKFPLLGNHIEGTWNLVLCNEFHMTNDSGLFRTEPGPGRLPLFEGKMIHQFNHLWGNPRYWLDEQEAAEELRNARIKGVKKIAKTWEIEWEERETIRLDYLSYRLAFRDVARNTDERTMIMTVLPPRVFCPHTVSLEQVYEACLDYDDDDGFNPNFQRLTLPSRLFVCAVMNSLVVDAWFRRSVTAHLSFFFVYNTPVPRLRESDPAFWPIVERAARLICTTPEFDDLAREVGLGSHANGATDDRERARLRAELDGLVAHLYGLTEDEFAYILTTFPIVPQAVKDAALDAYRALAPRPDAKQLLALIAGGESDRLEFKVAACWNAFNKKKEDGMKTNITQAVAAFLNSRDGGAVVIGVDDKGTVVGIADDVRTADKGRPDRDGYEQFLRNALGSALGGDATLYYAVEFHDLGGREVCRLRVEPAAKPVYHDGDLYVRDGNKKRKLTAQEAAQYVKQRWKS